MTRRVMLSIAILLTLGLARPVAAAPGGVAGPTNAAFTATADFCADSEEAAFLTLINNYRAANGLPALVMSLTLSGASEHHSVDMAVNNYVSHTLFDGITWSQNIINHGSPIRPTQANTSPVVTRQRPKSFWARRTPLVTKL